jgi:hypothetical protein
VKDVQDAKKRIKISLKLMEIIGKIEIRIYQDYSGSVIQIVTKSYSTPLLTIAKLPVEFDDNRKTTV